LASGRRRQEKRPLISSITDKGTGLASGKRRQEKRPLISSKFKNTFLADEIIIYRKHKIYYKTEDKTHYTDEYWSGKKECSGMKKQIGFHKNLLIIGAGGHGNVVADIAGKMKKWQSIVFLDDDEEVIKSSRGIKVIGKSTDAKSYIKDHDIFIAIGSSKTRENLQTQLELAGANIPVLIHPSAVVAEQVELEAGSVVMAGVVISCNTRIGKGCIINTSTTVDHDNELGDYAHLSAGVHTGGGAKIGKGTFMGIASVVSSNVIITSGCTIGAGAVVIKDLLEAGTYVGVPARKVK